MKSLVSFIVKASDTTEYTPALYTFSEGETRPATGDFAGLLIQNKGARSAKLRPELNSDKILDCCARYPAYRSYFKEKIDKIKKLEFLLDNPDQRGKGETAAFLRRWISHFGDQINFVVSTLSQEKNQKFIVTHS